MATKLLPRADELPMQFFFYTDFRQSSIPFHPHIGESCAWNSRTLLVRVHVANLRNSIKMLRNFKFLDSFPCGGLNITAPARVTQHFMQISCCSLVIAPKSARRTSLGREIGCETLNSAEHAITRGLSSLAFIKVDLTSRKHVVLLSDFVDARSSAC